MTAPALTPAQRDLLTTLARRGVAFARANGWRVKGEHGSRSRQTAEALIAQRLATTLTGAGTLRLVLTDAGRALATGLKRRQPRRTT